MWLDAQDADYDKAFPGTSCKAIHLKSIETVNSLSPFLSALPTYLLVVFFTLTNLF
jgi:hypothetical protein